MRPADFCTFATDCINHIGGDASDRSAVRSAYYAVYHASHEYLVAANALPAGQTHHRLHQEVIAGIAARFPNEIRQVQALWTLKNHRRHADYVLDERVPVKHPSVDVDKARMILSWLETKPR